MMKTSHCRFITRWIITGAPRHYPPTPMLQIKCLQTCTKSRLELTAYMRNATLPPEPRRCAVAQKSWNHRSTTGLPQILPQLGGFCHRGSTLSFVCRLAWEQKCELTWTCSRAEVWTSKDQFLPDQLRDMHITKGSPMQKPVKQV